jgi:glycosyltransferase involved in cell wall biosynthesis
MSDGAHDGLQVLDVHERWRKLRGSSWHRAVQRRDDRHLLRTVEVLAKALGDPKVEIDSAPGDVMPAPWVSVIVPTRNSERTLNSCLASVRAQSWPNLELIVVDNASTDGTTQIARAFADRVLSIGPERSTQRNAGAHASSGDFLFFVDSDMVLEEEVVEQAVNAACAAEAIVVPEASFGTGFWARCKQLERSCYVGDATIEAARFFTRARFEAVGGYDDDLRGTEDWDLHARVLGVGASLGRTRAFIHHDEGNLRLRALVAKKYSYGTGAGRYPSRHPKAFRAQRRLLRAGFRTRRDVLLSQPLTASGMFAMKACEYFAFGLGLMKAAARPVMRRVRASG